MAALFVYMNLRAGKAGGSAPRYLHILTACALLEAAGYAARVYAIEQANLNAYIAQSFLILVVPIALALINYIIVGRLLKATGKQVWCLRPDHLARVFVISDIVCFILQAGGSGLSTQASLHSIGEANAIVGIALQLGFYTAFLALTLTLAFGRDFKLQSIPQLRPVFYGLYVTSAFIYARNIFRIAQYAAGSDGLAATSEILFNLCETMFMLAACGAFAYWHPGMMLPSDNGALADLVARRGLVPEGDTATYGSTGVAAADGKVACLDVEATVGAASGGHAGVQLR